MVGRATWLVRYLACAAVMMLIVGTISRHLGDDAPLSGRPMSPSTFGKFQVFSVCVGSISGSRNESEAVLGRLRFALDSLDFPARAPFALPAAGDVGCPRTGPVRCWLNGVARRRRGRGCAPSAQSV